MEKTKIAWTDATFNPWWGCTKVSPGCERCYAETFSRRVGQKVWGPDAPRRFFGYKHWIEPLKWNEKAKTSGKPFRVFCASMADVFEDRRDLDEPRARLFALISSTRYLTWLLLTKRPENIRAMVPPLWMGAGFPGNVWMLTTAEDQKRLEERAKWLFRLPCVVRGISYEPAVGPLDLSIAPAYVDWIICGGESGHGARPMDPSWARSVRDQCRKAGIAFFMKQMGGAQDKLDDLEDLPEDLRVRNFPR